MCLGVWLVHISILVSMYLLVCLLVCFCLCATVYLRMYQNGCVVHINMGMYQYVISMHVSVMCVGMLVCQCYYVCQHVCELVSVFVCICVHVSVLTGVVCYYGLVWVCSLNSSVCVPSCYASMCVHVYVLVWVWC